VTKKDLAKTIADKLHINQLQALEVVQMTFDGIIAALVHEGRIELRNFGVFEVKVRQARSARNPRTGEKVMVPKRAVVTFKPGREMEQRVAQSRAAGHRPVRTARGAGEEDKGPKAGQSSSGAAGTSAAER
jgi:integration host factor subunit beta